MSLKYRIALIIFFLEAAMMVAVLTQTTSRFDQATRLHLAEAEDVVLNLLTGVGRTALLTQEYAEMQPYLDRVGDDPRVLRAMLADHRGVVVASLNGRDIGAPLPEETTQDHFWRTEIISNATGMLGIAAVEFSNAPLREASSRIRRHAIGIAVVGMSLIAIVGVGTGVLLTRKLERVSTAAQRLTSGELSARSNVDGSDELGQLGKNFDRMADALEEDRQQIEKTEKALRYREEHYRSLIDNASISIHEIDSSGRLISMNRSGLSMMEISDASAVLDRPFLDLVAENHRDRASVFLEHAWHGKSSEFEFMRTVAGSTKTFRSSFHPISDESGQFTKILGLAQDITDRKQAEEALRTSETRLRQAQKMEAIGLLAGGVAHDFNNILTVINGNSDLILRRDDFPYRDRVEEISKASQRAASLTHQLLAFSRRQVLQPRVIDLNASVLEAKKMLSRVLGEDIEFVMELDPALEPVKADPGQIHQVIMNLAINARDAMPQGGTLTLETKNLVLDAEHARRYEGLSPGHYVKLIVKDTGIGMTDDVVSHLFEPFFTTKEVHRGTGLGLATVYGIVKQSDGYIAVESTPRRGSTFEIFLPQVKEQRSSAPTFASAERQCSGTILLVEDDVAVRSLARDVLNGQGYRVLEAQDGPCALRILVAHDERVSLMITDLVMPKMSGPELATRVTSLYPKVKVLFMTGYFAGIHESALLGDANLLKKPFTVAALLEKVAEILEDSPSLARSN